MKTLLAVGCAVTAMLMRSSVANAAPHFGAWDVTSAFFIGKSENKNEVHYGVRLDAQCNVLGAQPVYAYWQMKELALPHVEDLLPREESGYGIASQTVTGSSILVTLRALPDRPILIRVTTIETGCAAVGQMNIAQTWARLDRVFLQLAWPFGVSWLKLFGSTDAGVPVQEKIAK